MRAFTENYREYVEKACQSEDTFGFSIDRIASIEPFLTFLYRNWWKVDLQGLNQLPGQGPALIVGNAGGILPWCALMLLYALMSSPSNPRRLSIICDMDWIEDERVYSLLREIGCVPWSSANAKQLFAAGQLVAIFPEGVPGMTKEFSERYRLRQFDWTKLLSAVEADLPIFPMATLGCEESIPVLSNHEGLARLLNMPAFPITPFFPLLPFPLSMLASLPGNWQMRILKCFPHPTFGSKLSTTDPRDRAQQMAIEESTFIQGQIQAELNRLLRGRIKAF